MGEGDASLQGREPGAIWLDPTKPILPITAAAGESSTPALGGGQRQRRAAILAVIRQLLIDEGYGRLTIRRIAERSGFAVQTIYNLVGPRDLAIVEALSEYPWALAHAVRPDLDDPQAIVRTIELQGQTVRTAPEFCRQVCLISFTSDRHIFYDFRARRTKTLEATLVKQKQRGVIRDDVPCGDLAETLMLYSSAVFTEWADRACSLDHLVNRVSVGYAQILRGAIEQKRSRRSDWSG